MAWAMWVEQSWDITVFGKDIHLFELEMSYRSY